jgi:hypothetical protein
MRPIATAREGLGEARVTRRRKAEVEMEGAREGGREATIREGGGGRTRLVLNRIIRTRHVEQATGATV